MSTGADCYFKEDAPREWYYHIQQYPYGDTEEYDTHGPFSSFRAAEKHLNRMYANPGAFSISPHPDSDDKSWKDE